MTLFVAMALTACGGATNNNQNNQSGEQGGDSSANAPSQSSTHTHTFDETRWESNDTIHWHPATCEHTNQKKDSAAHDWEIDPTQTEGLATCTTKGNIYERCKVCGKTRTTENVLAEHAWQAVAHTAGAGEVTETIRECSSCHRQEIIWDAQDAAKVFEQNNEKNEGEFNSSGKLTKNGNTIAYTFWAPAAKTMRLWTKITYQSQEHATKSNREYRQGLWYNYKEEDGLDGTGWKNQVKLGTTLIDQAAQKYTVDDEDIDLKKLVFEDFGDDSTGPNYVPWVELSVAEGANTLSIMRNTGYANSFVEFKLVG